MSNLGLYQVLTKAAKKVGGVKNLVALIGAAGYVTGKFVEFGAKGIHKISASRKTELSQPKTTYFISEDSDFENGLLLHIGDEFSVIAEDGETTIIEVVGNSENPYAVSTQLLIANSGYKGV